MTLSEFNKLANKAKVITVITCLYGDYWNCVVTTRESSKRHVKEVLESGNKIWCLEYAGAVHLQSNGDDPDAVEITSD